MVLDLLNGNIHILVQPVILSFQHIFIKFSDVLYPIHPFIYLIQVDRRSVSCLFQKPGQIVSHTGQLIQLIFQLSQRIFTIINLDVWFKLPHDTAYVFSSPDPSVILALLYDTALTSGDSAYIVSCVKVAYGSQVAAV